MVTKEKQQDIVASLDIAIGPVISIYDQRTFKMKVNRIGTHNKFNYQDYEIIRIPNVSIRKNGSPKTENTTVLNFEGKNVRCTIHFRNEYNVLIADVEVF
ncbi:MAG: hypothetical protein K0S33_2948 [Bacteroidetes bacterium]|jgi:hypothetical protein|nr:hypothetical protein [Bacteroidota bacterium]